MNTEQSLISELESAIKIGSKEQRINTLRRITDLFLVDADRLNNQQIEVFDDVLGRLTRSIEGKAIAELSRRLGPIGNAPPQLVRQLARDEDIDVADPVLTQSPRLANTDLIEIANTKSHAHLLAISARSQLDSAVTDVLLHKGDKQVRYQLATNSGARFSEAGFATLVNHSEHDGQLAEKVGLRLDLPLQLLRQLIIRATEAVRARLLALAGPESREHIRRVLNTVSEELGSQVGIPQERDYAEAQLFVSSLHKNGDLNEATLVAFAKSHRLLEAIAALSLLCSASCELVANLLRSEHREAFLVPCKAAGLKWSTVTALMIAVSGVRTMSDQDFDKARADYSKLQPASAQRVLRFWQVRQAASPTPGSSNPPPHLRAAG